ncbi:MAG: LptF/LptG family permease [Candidatus Margulisiibacteriota bacterium]
MKILDRYLAGELVSPFLLGIAGFVLIMTTDLLFTFVDMIINKGIPVWAIVRLIIYKLPAIMVLTFPVSFLFAAALVLGRMSRDNELAAMRTSGISFFRISIPVVIIAVIVSLLAFFTNESIVPLANKISDGVIRQIIYKQPVTDIKENVFFKDSFGRHYYIRRVSKKNSELEGVMVYELTGSSLPRIITAKKAVPSEGKWKLVDGMIHSFDDSGHMKYEASFASADILVEENVMRFSEQKTTDEMNSAELKALIASMDKGGVGTSALATDFFMKFSIPSTTLVFALLGIPLSIPAQRAGKSWGFAISVIIVFSFYVFASVFRSMGRGGMIAPFAAAWFPPALIALFGTILIYREARR